jgi:hypothetical protein
MNPDSCRQAVYLKKMLPFFNYYEASRSGVSFIEAMEIASQLNSLNPLNQLIYVHDTDFLESVIQIKKMPDITQYDILDEKILPGTLKSPGLKKILYSWKFMYYLFSNYSFATGNNNDTEIKNGVTTRLSITKKQMDQISELLLFVRKNYKTKNITLVLRPHANEQLLDLLKDYNFNVILLVDNMEKDWTFEYDSHWTCIGHEEAAKQVKNSLKSMNFAF